MPSLSNDRKQKWIALAAACALCVALFAAMCLLTGKDPCEYLYPTYLLQAKAWLRGETALDQNYEYLELAVYNGRYYVSFPPVPAVPMLLWMQIFGDSVPGGLFQKLYVMIACLLILSELMRVKKIPLRECVAWAVLICFACALFPITLVGAVWFEAQILAFLFCVSAIIAVRRNHPTLACICYALSVGCRPLCACMGPALLMLYLDMARSEAIPLKKALIRLIPGVLCGAAIAAGYGWYNYIRFGNPLEFGYKYLPEHARSAEGQISLRYFRDNFRTVFFGAPFRLENNGIAFNMFGFCLFLSCPILICQTVWFAQDAARQRMTPAKWALLICGCGQLFLLLLHHTAGGQQFGYRYAIELIPYAFAWLLISPERQSLSRWETVLLAFGLIFNLIGGSAVHI